MNANLIGWLFWGIGVITPEQYVAIWVPCFLLALLFWFVLDGEA